MLMDNPLGGGGSLMGVTWVSHGCLSHGYHMAVSWVLHGCPMDLMDITCMSHNYHMVISCASHCSLHMCHMGVSCVCHGCQISTFLKLSFLLVTKLLCLANQRHDYGAVGLKIYFFDCKRQK